MTTSTPEVAAVAGVAAVVTEHDEGQRRITDLAEAAVRRLWRRMRGRRWSTTWRDDVGPQVAEVIGRAQAAAVAQTASYARSALTELGMDAAEPNALDPDGFVGVTGEGSPVVERAYSAVLDTVDTFYREQDQGATREAAANTALLSGEDYAAAVTAEILADATRAAEAVAFAARPWVDGYVRSAEPGACSRCIVLAGKFFLFSDGFLRHPLCRCNHLPAPSDKSQLRSLIDVSSPRRYFDALTEAEQNKTFGKAGADAIRAGADIGQVVNARSGMRSVGQTQLRDGVTKDGRATRLNVTTRRAATRNINGIPGLTTTAGTTRRGSASRRLRENGLRVRLMPETLAIMANGNRAEFIRLLRENGFLLD